MSFPEDRRLVIETHLEVLIKWYVVWIQTFLYSLHSRLPSGTKICKGHAQRWINADICGQSFSAFVMFGCFLEDLQIHDILDTHNNSFCTLGFPYNHGLVKVYIPQLNRFRP